MAHTSIEQLKKKYTVAIKEISIGDIYCHYRNQTQLYKVLHLAFDEATEEISVVYQCLSSNIIWIRPLSSWLAMVDHNNQQVQRFRKSTEIKMGI